MKIDVSSRNNKFIYLFKEIQKNCNSFNETIDVDIALEKYDFADLVNGIKILLKYFFGQYFLDK